MYLEWDHSYYGEQGITGYYLYARKTGERQFRLLTATPITRPFYVDSTNHSQPVEYAVTTTDVWGNQSILSPLSAVGEELAVTVAPPATVTLGNRPNGIAISWPVPYETDNIKYCIYRKLATETSFRKIAIVDPAQAYIDTTAQKNKLYEYAISVLVNGQSESMRSNASSIRRW